MNNQANINRKANIVRSQLSRRLIIQYIITLGVFLAVYFLFVLLAYLISSFFIWYEEDSLYQLLRWIKQNIFVVSAVIIFIGMFAISSYFLIKPLKYLDEIITASELLAIQNDTPIMLSSQLKNVENEMNLIRGKALRSIDAARAAEQRKNDLIVYLAHDLKTPLTSVIGYLTLLRDEQKISPELRTRYTEIALDKAERLEDLTNEFFDITRFNLSQIELEKSPTDLTRMLEQLAYEFRPIFFEKHLDYSLNLPKQLIFDCDSDKMSRVFDNLLRNAYHYSSPNSKIEISGIENGNDITLTFLNHGKTIPAEKINRIFDQFYRLDSSRSTKTGGSGLGLAIAKEIVNRHGGTIEAQSADNIVIFTLSLPKHMP